MIEKLKYGLLWLKGNIALVITFLLLIIGTFISIILFRKESKLLDSLEESSMNYRKDLDNLKRIRDNELQERILIERRYQEQIERLQKEHLEALNNLDKGKEKLVKDVLKETKDSPEKAAQRINEIFGIPIQK